MFSIQISCTHADGGGGWTDLNVLQIALHGPSHPLRSMWATAVCCTQCASLQTSPEVTSPKYIAELRAELSVSGTSKIQSAKNDSPRVQTEHSSPESFSLRSECAHTTETASGVPRTLLVCPATLYVPPLECQSRFAIVCSMLTQDSSAASATVGVKSQTYKRVRPSCCATQCHAPAAIQVELVSYVRRTS